MKKLKDVIVRGGLGVLIGGFVGLTAFVCYNHTVHDGKIKYHGLYNGRHRSMATGLTSYVTHSKYKNVQPSSSDKLIKNYVLVTKGDVLINQFSDSEETYFEFDDDKKIDIIQKEGSPTLYREKDYAQNKEKFDKADSFFAKYLKDYGDFYCETKPDDFIEITSVEYTPKQGNRLPEIVIGTKGYDNELPGEVHYYIDGDYVFSWTPPKTFDSNGKCIGDYGWDSIKFGAVCLPHEKGKAVTNYKNLKEGQHTLKAVLEDIHGNIVEDTYTFEVK